MNQSGILNGIEDEIKPFLYKYIQARSLTYTPAERDAERFLMEELGADPYFQAHPEYFGTCEIEGDPFQRRVSYAMVRGQGNDAVVFVHHNDVVDVEDYKLLKEYAFSPDELEKELAGIRESLPEDAGRDLESGEWLFGRGGCDMKGGGAIQFSLLRRYAQLPDFRGNVIVIAVPDEENLSAGMRRAVQLLAELKDRYGFNYKIMFNSEPHQRKNPDVGIISEGSVGKLLPFVYVRGYLSHIGKVYEGLNPVSLLSEIVRRTELNVDFSDVVGNECAPPPTWLYMKDSKKHYDVSMPLSASGCFSVLTLDQSPQSLLNKVKSVCEEAFECVVADMNDSYRRFCETAEPVASELPWKSRVEDFDTLLREATEAYGDRFREAYERKRKDALARVASGETDLIECNFEIVDFVFEYIDDFSPRVIYGLIPPYYPNVSNVFFEGLEPSVAGLYEKLDQFAAENFRQHYEREYFYTGICDLSFTSIRGGADIRKALERSMPLLGEYFDLPIEAIEKISMPCMNIGPWGKDFHKMTERVYKEDLYERTPMLLNRAVELILNGGQPLKGVLNGQGKKDDCTINAG